jgi:hypothetical protein
MIFSNLQTSFILRFLSLVTVSLLAFCVSACSESDDSSLALISCITCSGKVSKNAFVCPHCGEPRARTTPVSGWRAHRAKPSFARAKAATIAKTIHLYVLDMGLSKPSDDFDLGILLLSPDDGGGPLGPYLERADDIMDPWGNPFEIKVPGEINASFDVISLGEDGEVGGEDVNADITQ